MLDCREITTEMVHEHFLEILHLFPVLVSRLETKNLSCPPRPLHSLEPAPRSTAQIKPEVKFNGPFSIDSILKRDFTSAQAYTPTLSLPVRVEHFTQPTQRRTGTKRCFGWDTDQHLILQASAGCSPVCTGGGSTHHWATADGTTTPVKRILFPRSRFTRELSLCLPARRAVASLMPFQHLPPVFPVFDS